MTDDPIPTPAEALAQIRRERDRPEGETHWEFEERVKQLQDRMSADYRHLRDRIVEMAEMPDAEAMQHLRRLAEGIQIRKAAYAEWLKEHAAQAMQRGTMAQRTEDEPTQYTHNVPPNAPR